MSVTSWSGGSVALGAAERSVKRGRKRPYGTKLKRWALLAVLTVTAFLWLMPFVYMVDVSLRLPQDSFDPSILVGRATLANFSAVLKGTPIGPLREAVLISAVTVACVVAAASAYLSVSILRVRYSLAM